MRRAARAIVVNDNKFLVMHRNKFGQEYYTLIGGGVKVGETPEQALLREMHEETGLQVANPRLVFVEESGAPYGTQYIYMCDFVGGEIVMSPSSHEAAINAMGKNLHTPMWLPLAQLPSVTFRTERLKNAILDGLKSGFPDQPKTL